MNIWLGLYTFGVIHMSADAKNANFGTPPSWHYADIFLGTPLLADSQRPSKKCRSARILAPLEKFFRTPLDKIVETPI